MKVECPQCHKVIVWEQSPTRPFCSDRCRLIDLGQWADEKYAVPLEHDQNSESVVPDGDDDDA